MCKVFIDERIGTRKGRFFMANYTDEQKSRIMQMPAAVLLDAIIADAGSAVVGIREFMAGEKFFSDAGGLYPGTPCY